MSQATGPIDIAIILLNYNGNDDTIQCLHSIRKYNQTLNLMVVLVDNASRNPLSAAEVEAAYPGIIYILNNNNDGFAEGNNIGMREAIKYDPKYIWLLNNDTLLLDDSLTRMFHFMEANPEYGVCGAVNYYFSEPDKMWQAGLMVNFKNGTQKPVEDFDVNSSEPIEVDYVPGSSFLIPTELLKQTGLLDARYFAYFEEIDLCVQVKKLGKKVAFIPNAKILHKVGQSADSVVKFYLKNRNRMLFYSRHAKGGWFTYIFLKEFAKNLIKATVYNAKAGNVGFYKSYFLALKDFFGKKYHNGSIPKLIAK